MKKHLQITDAVTDKNSSVEIRKIEEGSYILKISGEKGKTYDFTIKDDENEYNLEYHYDEESQSVVVNKK